jgi:hypothetical protein
MLLKNSKNGPSQKLGQIALKANIRAKSAFSQPAVNAGGFGVDLASPPNSPFVCRVHDPTNFGSMPEMEFFNSIVEICTVHLLAKGQRLIAAVSARSQLAFGTLPASCAFESTVRRCIQLFRRTAMGKQLSIWTAAGAMLLLGSTSGAYARCSSGEIANFLCDAGVINKPTANGLDGAHAAVGNPLDRAGAAAAQY